MILTRKIDQAIEIKMGDEVVTVTILGVQRDRVKVGIAAPMTVTILRTELVGKPPSKDTMEETAEGAL